METRNRTMLFHGLVVDIEQFEVRIGKKGWHTYQIVRHPGGVGVLPLHDDGTVTLIRQLRPAVGGTLREIPAGRLQAGEDPAECGAREMAEETGLSARELIPLGCFYPSPGVFDEVIHLFLGTGLSQGRSQPEHYEEIATERMPIGEALRLAATGEIRDGKTIAALLRAGNVVR
ncbi:MAG: DNA mismatch repair protein MutT [Deltaproteobacteria bacterium RIFOXYB2_FULL_66_7]|nr:MAG: DNA mismatch repair protein MutT [Deltaproteobacteria bacterium RIFOXYB2_FULL_66_7]